MPWDGLPLCTDFLTVVALVLWSLAMLWLGPLIAAEALRPRLSYDVRRWATVFPLGMYAASTFALSQITGITWLDQHLRLSVDLAGDHRERVRARWAHPSQLAGAIWMIPDPWSRVPARASATGATARLQRECGCQDQPRWYRQADH